MKKNISADEVQVEAIQVVLCNYISSFLFVLPSYVIQMNLKRLICLADNARFLNMIFKAF